jgi:hypothetical protein
VGQIDDRGLARCQNRNREGKAVPRAKAVGVPVKVDGAKVDAARIAATGVTTAEVSAATADAPKALLRSSWKN